jgi:hypothetical protein
LTEINQRRVKLAGEEYSVKPVTINDKVHCPVQECEGTMSYVATDSSDKFYVNEKGAAGEQPMGGAESLLGDEGAVEETPPEETPAAAKPPKKEPEKDPLLEEEPPAEEQPADDFNIDDLFEDVETQNEKSKAIKQDKTETTQKARKERTDEQTRLEEQGTEPGLGIPPDKEPLADPVTKTEPDPLAVKEEPGLGLEEPKPKKPKKKPEDIIKKDVPKFKSKEASERYEAVCNRYSV